MRLGVTGSRTGLTPEQYITAVQLFTKYGDEIDIMHNGGCVGADYKLFILCAAFAPEGSHIDIWPANLSDSLKFDYPDWDFVHVHKPLPPLERNLRIIALSDEIWAFPNTFTDPGRGGTWHTIRNARLWGTRLIRIVYPDGSYHTEVK